MLTADKPAYFIILYCVCGLTDIADGYLARAYNAETKLGSKLDSAGDLVFFAVWIYIFYRFIGDNLKLTVAWMAVVAAIRIVNFVITKVKFKQWSMMHTVGNKIAGLALFIVLPFYILTGGTPPWSLWAIGLISAISALEESVILLRYANYDVNKRTILN